ncbi:hypothetical protein M427DRAFT_493766, partial [Gonapodya prolifera JEL478]
DASNTSLKSAARLLTSTKRVLPTLVSTSVYKSELPFTQGLESPKMSSTSTVLETGESSSTSSSTEIPETGQVTPTTSSLSPPAYPSSITAVSFCFRNFDGCTSSDLAYSTPTPNFSLSAPEAQLGSATVFSTTSYTGTSESDVTTSVELSSLASTSFSRAMDSSTLSQRNSFISESISSEATPSSLSPSFSRAMDSSTLSQSNSFISESISSEATPSSLSLSFSRAMDSSTLSQSNSFISESISSEATPSSLSLSFSRAMDSSTLSQSNSFISESISSEATPSSLSPTAYVTPIPTCEANQVMCFSYCIPSETVCCSGGVWCPKGFTCGESRTCRGVVGSAGMVFNATSAVFPWTKTVTVTKTSSEVVPTSQTGSLTSQTSTSKFTEPNSNISAAASSRLSPGVLAAALLRNRRRRRKTRHRLASDSKPLVGTDSLASAASQGSSALIEANSSLSSAGWGGGLARSNIDGDEAGFTSYSSTRTQHWLFTAISSAILSTHPDPTTLSAAQELQRLQGILVGLRYNAVQDYTPRNQDEMHVQGGDMVSLSRLFADGWGHGTNERTCEVGFVPVDILDVRALSGLGGSRSESMSRIGLSGFTGMFPPSGTTAESCGLFLLSATVYKVTFYLQNEKILPLSMSEALQNAPSISPAGSTNLPSASIVSVSPPAPPTLAVSSYTVSPTILTAVSKTITVPPSTSSIQSFDTKTAIAPSSSASGQMLSSSLYTPSAVASGAGTTSTSALQSVTSSTTALPSNTLMGSVLSMSTSRNQITSSDVTPGTTSSMASSTTTISIAREYTSTTISPSARASSSVWTTSFSWSSFSTWSTLYTTVPTCGANQLTYNTYCIPSETVCCAGGVWCPSGFTCESSETCLGGEGSPGVIVPATSAVSQSTSTATLTTTVAPSSSSSSTIASTSVLGGVIAGIAAGSAFAILILAAILAVFVRRRSHSSEDQHMNPVDVISLTEQRFTKDGRAVDSLATNTLPDSGSTLVPAGPAPHTPQWGGGTRSPSSYSLTSSRTPHWLFTAISSAILSANPDPTTLAAAQALQRRQGIPVRLQYSAVHGFSPRNQDEMHVEEGDTVTLSRLFADGWGNGTNERTGEVGFVPVDITDVRTASGVQGSNIGWSWSVSGSYLGDSGYRPIFPPSGTTVETAYVLGTPWSRTMSLPDRGVSWARQLSPRGDAGSARF